MDQLEFFDIPSPCIGICQSGKGGFCTGCFRSREERLYWNQATPYAKRIIIKASLRRKAIAQRKGKSEAKTTISQQTDLFDE